LLRLQNNIQTLGDFILLLQTEYFDKLMAMNTFYESIEIPEDPDFPSIMSDNK
jgi:hypothetical protein